MKRISFMQACQFLNPENLNSISSRSLPIRDFPTLLRKHLLSKNQALLPLFFFFFFFFFNFHSKCNSKTLDFASASRISLLSWVFLFKSENSFFLINSEEWILLKLLNSFIVTLCFCYFCQNSLFKLS